MPELVFRFLVKFYTPDPELLEEELTRSFYIDMHFVVTVITRAQLLLRWPRSIAQVKQWKDEGGFRQNYERNASAVRNDTVPKTTVFWLHLCHNAVGLPSVSLT